MQIKYFTKLMPIFFVLLFAVDCLETNSGGGTEIGNIPTVTTGRLIKGTLVTTDTQNSLCTVDTVFLSDATETTTITTTPDAEGNFEMRAEVNFVYRIDLLNLGSVVNSLNVDNGDFEAIIASPYSMFNYYNGEDMDLGNISCQDGVFTPVQNPASVNDADKDGTVDYYDNTFNIETTAYWPCSGPVGRDCDSDELYGSDDNCPFMSSTNVTDSDGDGIGDVCDNCGAVANADQSDSDSDWIGDACEDTMTDSDGDGIANETDNCPTSFNSDQTDSDGDGVGDGCPANDSDGDGINDNIDNCYTIYNPDQADKDNDARDGGDACDDDDGDTIVEAMDNCIDVSNTDQTDTDKDGVGDACE